MTKPEKPPEPSMEDILASIRKIIADDPVKADGGTDGAASHPPGANGFANNRPPAPKPGASAIALNSPARNEIDSLLDDAVDDPPLARSPSSPLPSGGPLSGPPGQRPASSDAKRATASPAGAPAPTPPRPGTLPELKPSIDRPNAVAAGGDRPAFPSLGGSLAARLSPAGPGPTGRAADLSRSTLPPAFEELLAQRASSPDATGTAPVGKDGPSPDLGAFIPGQPSPLASGPAPAGAPIAAKNAGPGMAPPSPRRPGERNGESSAAASPTVDPPKPPDDLKTQAARSPAVPTPAAPPPAQAAKAAAASVPPSGAGRPASSPAPDRNDAGPQHPNELRPRETPVGAAATVPADKSGPSAPRPPAAPATASGPTSVPPSATAPSPEATAQPLVSAAQAKTLEDTLSEVLRPVVRQWVIDNMPRIVQEVAQQEVAKLPKPDTE